VNITQPLDNAVFAFGTGITINASASEPGGTISNIAFYAGTTWLAQSTNNPASFTWSGAPVGTNVLSAVATDVLGGTGTSAPVSIVVDIPPTALITNPTTNADYPLPATITISATASDSDGMVTNVTFFTNGVVLGSAAIAPYNWLWSPAAP